MKNKFTFSANQQKALNLTKQNMLISAGAGSGKTAVLIERLYQLYTVEQVKVSEVLVLVFGRLAAQELKERINEKLAKDAEFAHLIPEVEVANIVTFDAYALEIVRKYGANFGIPANITNLDEVMQKVKFTEYFDAILENYYENPTPLFTHFIKTFHARNTYSLLGFLLDFHYEVILKLDEEEYLNNYITTYYSDAKFNEYIATYLKKGRAILADIITTSKRLSHENYQEKYVQLYDDFNKIDTFTKLILFAADAKKPVMPNKFLENHPENAEDETKLKA
ncbi:MAG TPA: UvrD-helicase domain-containing protein, partial [Bacilli bacterium]|nr:UvrD-helicase domain-containing protein [Bacilli bacterium]